MTETILQEQIAVDPEFNRVKVQLESSLYPLDAIYGAAYVFIDRCYLLLDAVDEQHVTVELRGCSPLDPAALLALGGEFSNELLTHAWRHKIMERNRHIIETVTLQALTGAAGLPEPDALESDLSQLEDLPFDDDVFDDPLGIAVPWEEKYGMEAALDAAEPDAEPEVSPDEATSLDHDPDHAKERADD